MWLRGRSQAHSLRQPVLPIEVALEATDRKQRRAGGSWLAMLGLAQYRICDGMEALGEVV